MSKKVVPLKQMQAFVAETCIGASSLRGQGAGGLVKSSREFFKAIDLSKIPVDRTQFDKWLDRKTKLLLSRYPRKARHFGAARKAMALFLRCACYNVVLDREYRLHRILPLLEVPVDSFTAKHLRRLSDDLPRWQGIKRASPLELAEYQRVAQIVAKQMNLKNRVDLDLFFYRISL